MHRADARSGVEDVSVRRVAIIATASGCGKTTFGRALARILDVDFVELDAVHWQAGWTELDADTLRRRVEPIVADDAWVVDGSYRGKLGDLVLERADTVVWLDLPRRIWLPRLVRRTFRRAITGEELWNGNRETLRGAFLRADSLVRFALANDRPRRHRYPRELARFRVARLRSPAEVEGFLRAASDARRVSG
jgi:adenylate kinase family enzyme